MTYVQYRMDYPYFGSVARLYQYDGIYPAHTQTLTRSESDYAYTSISHASGTTVLPYANDKTDFIYEGTTQLGASTTANVLTLSSGFVSQIVSTTKIGTNVSSGSPGGTWGDVPSHTVSGLKNTSESTVAFTNRTSTGEWLVGFPNSVTNESWPGAASGTGIIRDVALTPELDSLRPATVTQFPNHSSLTLSTTLVYDGAGRASSTTVSGDNVASRTHSVNSFFYGRYPGQIVNPLGHASTIGSYDPRFGTVKSSSGPNGTSVSVVRDPFGRTTSTTNTDGVVTSTTYTDCPTGCGVSVYGISPSHYATIDSLVTPEQIIYYDSLGRVIRSQVESFSGLSNSKVDTKYDALGRVEKSSLPYFSGAPNDIIASYDIRNRVSNVSRPDGSSTGTVYSVDGNTVVVTVTDNVLKADGSSAGAQKKRNEYNILGQLTKTTDGFNTNTDPSITYTYDALGNALTVVVDGGVDGSTTTTMEYDEAGNQKEIVGPNIGTITSTYTALNEIRTQTDNKGQLFTHAFDVLGRLTSIVSPDGTSSWVWDTAANGTGKLKSRSNTGFTETYAYDTSSRHSGTVTSITPIGGSGSTDYTTSHTYDTYGRPLNTTFASGFVLTRAYNARGYLSQLKNGATAIQTINDLDAFGNSIDESYANGVDTLRTFDPETGRLTDINTTKGATTFQNNDYAWRSNGTLESRVANPAYGLAATRKETYDYDVLNRVELAETYINGSNIRDLVYEYDELGNIESKTSTVAGDTDVTGYAYGAGTAGPHAVTSASIDGVSNILTYDLNGAATKYDIAGTSNDKYIAYNAYNLPTTIVVGDSIADSSPVAKDEFAYGPNGQRYARRTTWQDGGSTHSEVAYYIGAVEIIYDNSVINIELVTKTKLSPNVMHVEMVGAVTDSFFEYAHRDYLGSIEVVTDENGNKLDNLAFDPFGSRKKPDWLAKATSSELDDLLELDWGHSSKVRGFTGHEHLDRTGFIHMNGRLYDPVLGRFLSPDPIVQFPTSTQSWNRHSYVGNSPASFTDPSGYEMEEITVTGSRLNIEPIGVHVGNLSHFLGGSFATNYQGANYNNATGTGTSDEVIEEVTVVGSPTDVSHRGYGSAFLPMGALGSFHLFAEFDDGGGVVVYAVGRSGSQRRAVAPSIVSTSSDGEPDTTFSDAIVNGGGIAGLLSVAIDLGRSSYINAMSLAEFGQPNRHARVARLTKFLNPVGKVAARLGIAGGAAEVIGSIFIGRATGNWTPLVVSSIGVGIGVAVGSFAGLPVLVAYSVIYAGADYFNAFDPNTYQ